LVDDEIVGFAEARERPGARIDVTNLMILLWALAGMTLSTAGAAMAPIPVFIKVRREKPADAILRTSVVLSVMANPP